MSNNYTIEKLYDACITGDVATAQACLARGVNINESPFGSNPLMTAVLHNQLEIVKILLDRDDLDLTVTNKYDNTALYMACTNGYDDIVALICQNRRMTGQIINMKNKYGDSALIWAVSQGSLSCVEMMSELDGVDWETKTNSGVSLEDKARIFGHMGVLKFLRKLKSEKDSPIQCKKIKLTKLTQTLEDFETKMEAEKIALGDQHKKKVDDLEKEFKEKLSAIHNRHKKQKEAMENEIRACSSPTPAPECPICLESLAPPARLYNCPEGHLLCSECRTKVQICHSCRKPLQGRATAMEQYLRAVYGQE